MFSQCKALGLFAGALRFAAGRVRPHQPRQDFPLNHPFERGFPQGGGVLTGFARARGGFKVGAVDVHLVAPTSALRIGPPGDMVKFFHRLLHSRPLTRFVDQDFLAADPSAPMRIVRSRRRSLSSGRRTML
jgi:hypothetical protein